MSETPQERAQAWCEEHAEHKSVPGTKFVSGRLLCSRDDVVKLLQPLEAEVERLKETDRASFRAWEKSEAEVARLRAALLKRGLSPAPCDICGYNGPGYHQSNTHICAALREISLLEDDPLRASKTRSIIARAALRGEGEK